MCNKYYVGSCLLSSLLLSWHAYHYPRHTILKAITHKVLNTYRNDNTQLIALSLSLSLSPFLQYIRLYVMYKYDDDLHWLVHTAQL